MSTLQAIETRYAGRKFRGRLEARWARFFDAAGIHWNYEPQGYTLDGTYYLPDFWLPDQGAFFEVKGELAGAERYFALHKAHALAARSNRLVLVSIGDLPYPYPTLEEQGGTALALYPNGDEDSPYWWCACPECGRLGMTYAGRADNLDCGCLGAADACCGFVTYQAQRFQRAYEAALSARFEHGAAG